MLRVLVLHDALQLLLPPLLLLPSDQHLSAYLLDCHRDILAQAGTFRPLPARPSRCVVRLGLVRALRVGRARGAPFTA